MAAFPKMTLTNAGQALQTKVLAGATLTFTRIGLGDGQLNGQPISPLTALINQTASVEVSSVVVINTNTCQASGLFSNADIQAGFQWRETGLFAQDPDEGEILYAYTNAGDAGDYIPTVSDTRIEKYIYCSIAVASATTVNITIPESDTYIPTTEKGQAGGVATLDTSGKVPSNQLPDMNFDPAGSAQTVQTNLTDHINDKNNPHHVTANQVGADPAGSAQVVQTNLTDHIDNKTVHVTTLSASYSGKVHALTGFPAASGLVSCVFTAAANYTAGDTFTVDGTPYTIQLSNGETADDNLFVSGATVSVVIDTAGKKVNFKAGGGLSNSALALATALVSDVAQGKTFYAGDKTLKTGTASVTKFASGTFKSYNFNNYVINLGWKPKYAFFMVLKKDDYDFFTAIYWENGNCTGFFGRDNGGVYLQNNSAHSNIVATETGFVLNNYQFSGNYGEDYYWMFNNNNTDHFYWAFG